MKHCWFLAAVAALLAVSCPNPSGGGSDSTSPANAFVVFDNSANSFLVGMYAHPDRSTGNRLAEIGARQLSGEVGFSPQPDGFSFYPRYYVSVEGIVFPVDPVQGTVQMMIPNGKTTTVPVKALTSVVNPGDPLTNDAYLLLTNHSGSMISLVRGSVIMPNQDGLIAVNPNETGLFKVSPSNASDYNILILADRYPFPSGKTFESGHIYVIDFDGSAVTIEKDETADIGNVETGGCFVSFDANGGTGTTPAPRWAKEGGNIILPVGEGLSRPGYAFTGWNTNANGTGQNYAEGEAYIPQESIALYARWEAIFTISFDANGGTGNPPEPQTVESGSVITIPGPGSLSKPDLDFAGWNTKADGTGQNYSEGETYTPTRSLTLYAQWLDTKHYTVFFDANGGTGNPPSPESVEIGSGMTLPGSGSLSRPGYVFSGWNTDASGTGQNYSEGQAYTPQGNTTLYAKWTLPVTNFTISFDANGGNGDMPSQTVDEGGSMTIPESDFTRGKYSFIFWNTEADGSGSDFYPGSQFTPTGTTTLYATWVYMGNTLAEQLKWLYANARDNTKYLVEVSTTESISPANAALPSGKNGVVITLKSSGGIQEIQLASQGSLFAIQPGITLELDENITLVGRESNDNPLVTMTITNGGTLVMNAGAKITGNRNDTRNYGGGVGLRGDCTFNMYGGEISYNTSSGSGGGVLIFRGTFNMYDGEISHNTSSDSIVAGNGVYILEGIFNMHGGEVSYNTGSGFGGGVASSGTFNMHGGEVSYNTSSGYDSGGGVYTQGAFNMYGGEISHNSSYSGGGVAIGSGTFNIHGGKIFHNNSISGGGVYSYPNNGLLRISNGIIYGSNAGDNSNTAQSGGVSLYGTAQYGTFNSDDTFNVEGTISTTDNTIEVKNGILQPWR